MLQVSYTSSLMFVSLDELSEHLERNWAILFQEIFHPGTSPPAVRNQMLLSTLYWTSDITCRVNAGWVKYLKFIENTETASDFKINKIQCKFWGFSHQCGTWLHSSGIQQGVISHKDRILISNRAMDSESFRIQITEKGLATQIYLSFYLTHIHFNCIYLNTFDIFNS